MLPIVRVMTGLLTLSLAAPVAAQQPIVYPSKGQSPQLQQNDTAQCQTWAKQTTGVDPVALAQYASTQPGVPGPQGERVAGAAGGAAAGAMIGAIAGDAGKGAAIGAVTGTVGGGMRQRQKTAGSGWPKSGEPAADAAATGHLQSRGRGLHDRPRLYGPINGPIKRSSSHRDQQEKLR